MVSSPCRVDDWSSGPGASRSGSGRGEFARGTGGSLCSAFPRVTRSGSSGRLVRQPDGARRDQRVITDLRHCYEVAEVPESGSVASRVRVISGHTGGVAARNIDDYLSSLDELKRGTLQQVRRSILEVIPEAEECISYGMPAFKVQGATVAGFAAFKNHLSYLPHSGSVLPALGDHLTGYERTTGSLHFAVDQPLPATLINRLVTTRLAQLGLSKEG